MKILFNCSTNIVGGGVKNSAIFIKNALEDSSVSWYFAISKPVFSELEDELVSCEKFSVFERSPARCSESRRKILSLEKDLSPDVVYTMAGPAYVSFKSYHVMGISNPYLSHVSFLEYFKFLSYSGALRRYFLTLYQR